MPRQGQELGQETSHVPSETKGSGSTPQLPTQGFLTKPICSLPPAPRDCPGTMFRFYESDCRLPTPIK